MLIVMDYIITENDIEKIINEVNCDTATELFIKHSKLNPSIFDNNYVYHIIATSPNNLKTIFSFFKKFKPTGNQKIMLKSVDISFKELENILKEYEECDFMDKLILDASYDKSRDFVYKEEFDQMSVIINKVKKTIPENASKLEIITYVYNWLKKREYKHDDENPTYSKLYSTALLTDYIVCVGFSKVFNNILSYYNINSSEYKFFYLDNNEKKGHDISIVNVKDEKYGVDGIYFFDLTRDCYNHNNNSYKYSGFMMTYDEVAQYNIVEDMFNKMLFCDDKDLQETIDSFKPEIDKLNPLDEEDEIDEENINKEIKSVIYNLIQIDSDLFKGMRSVDMFLMNTECGMIYFINRFILFLKQNLGTKVDTDTITNLLINTIKEKDVSYYLASINSYTSNNQEITYDLNKQFQYIKKSLDSK